jgi:hypothetical protein
MKMLPILVLFCGTTVMPAQTDSQSANRNEITGLIQQMAQMDAKNVEPSPQFIHDHLAEDLVYVWPMGSGGRDEFIKPDLTSPSLLEEKIDDVKIRFYGNTAVANATWYKKGKNPSEPNNVQEWHGFLMEVWVKKYGNWQLVSSAAGPLFHPQQGTSSK